MATPSAGSFNFWTGNRPFMNFNQSTGDMNHWIGNRPIQMLSTRFNINSMVGAGSKYFQLATPRPNNQNFFSFRSS